MNSRHTYILLGVLAPEVVARKALIFQVRLQCLQAVKQMPNVMMQEVLRQVPRVEVPAAASHGEDWQTHIL